MIAAYLKKTPEEVALATTFNALKVRFLKAGLHFSNLNSAWFPSYFIYIQILQFHVFFIQRKTQL